MISTCHFCRRKKQVCMNCKNCVESFCSRCIQCERHNCAKIPKDVKPMVRVVAQKIQKI